MTDDGSPPLRGAEFGSRAPWRVPPQAAPAGAPRPGPTTFAPPLAPPRPAVDLPDPLRTMLDLDGTGVVVLDGDGNVDMINATMMSLLGADQLDDLRPDEPARGVLGSFLDQVPRDLLLGRGSGVWRGEFDHQAPSGDALVLRSTVTVAPAAASGSIGPERRSIALLVHDVTASRRERAKLEHRAAHDPLTGLPNRHRILRRLAEAVAEQRDRHGHVAAIFIDLDHLKYANDAFGHRVGDQLLTSTAQRLSQAVRPNDRIARIGGDEFLVVSTDVPGADAALEFGERIRRALSGHLRFGDLDLEFSVSIGVAVSDDDLLDLPDDEAASILISNADSAMYAAKQNGRGQSTLFTSEMRSAARDRAEIAAALAKSVHDESLTLDYQAVFSTVTKLAVGAEALVRWSHPRFGRMDPATFVSVAEESGTIGRLGELVLRRAMRDLRTWIDERRVPSDFVVHVNVSRIQLASNAFVGTVMALLREHHLDPAQLVLEARETSLLGRVTDVDRSIRALRRFGVQVAVDNFGTGPKALAVMTDVGADMLKLDGALALPAGVSEADTRLARAIVLLAHALDMHVVAERVSGLDQLHRLRAAGCDMVQGNLLGQPGPAYQFVVESDQRW